MKKRKSKKKKKKEVISFKKLKVFRKIFSAFFSIVVIFDVFTHVIVRSQTVSAALRDSTERLAHSKVIEEQIGHFALIREVIKDSEKRAAEIEPIMGELETRGLLTNEQKKELATNLKYFEENSFTLQHLFEQYFTDATIQYNPKANSKITNYVYETSLLRIAIERFVRGAENTVLFSNPTANEREIILEDYYDILWQINHLKELQQDLKVFETLK